MAVPVATPELVFAVLLNGHVMVGGCSSKNKKHDDKSLKKCIHGVGWGGLGQGGGGVGQGGVVWGRVGGG